MKIFTAAIIAVLAASLGWQSPQVQAASKNTNTGRVVTGVVTYVSDGDTLWVRPVGSSEALDVRIQGIDAPENCQDYGLTAQQALSQHVRHKAVTLTMKARDKYGRLIAKVNLADQDVGAWMVANGHAWSYHFHRSAGPYAKEEMAARQARRGLWGHDNPMEPREFRRRTTCRKPYK